MSHWPWWLGALVLASVPLVHRILLNHAFAVSGRFSALVDRVRFGREEPVSDDTAALLAALREQTVEAFGADALDASDPQASALDMSDPQASSGATALSTSPQSMTAHVLFFVGLTLGGLVSALLAGAFELRTGLAGATFAALIERVHVPVPIVLLLGGVLVGVGTRMAAGCTSGHGLCGVSQLQPGSWVSTAAFFGAGVALSFAFGAVL